MRAITFEAPGDEDVLNWGVVPDVEPGPDEVVIDVAAAGVNNADLMQRQGKYPVPAGASEILGLECSGTIAALGEGVQEWEIGQRVAALLTGGGYAERVAVPAAQLLSVPGDLDLVEAAGLPEAACTVYSNIGMLAELQPGQSVLIHGGGSGIGTHAIQWAHALGARVFTTAGSVEKLQAAEKLGAEILINYREEDFAERIKAETEGAGVDAILDIIGASYLEQNVKSLAYNGHLVIIGAQGGVKGAELDLGRMLKRRLNVSATTLRGRPAEEKTEIVDAVRNHVWPMVTDRRIKPVVDTILPLQEAAEAHRHLAQGKAIGKVILQA